MNSKQQNKFSMYLAVQAVLGKHSDVVEVLPAFVAGVEELEEHLGKIQSLAQTQSSKNGATAGKAQAFQLLGDVAFEVAAAVRACAVASSNKDLAGRVEFSRSQVSKGRDSEVIARCQDILDAATENLPSLADYGVTAAKLTAFKKKIEGFQNVQVKPRQGKATSSAATKQLPAQFAQVDEVLNERLDGLLVQFKNSQPVLFNEYAAARVVVDNPGGRAARDATASGSTAIGSLPKAA